MKPPTVCLLALSLAGAFALLAPAPALHGQAAAPDPVPALVEEVVAQQTKIVENQKAMDEKIATIAEAVRQARIFAARGGGTLKK